MTDHPSLTPTTSNSSNDFDPTKQTFLLTSQQIKAHPPTPYWEEDGIKDLIRDAGLDLKDFVQPTPERQILHQIMVAIVTTYTFDDQKDLETKVNLMNFVISRDENAKKESDDLIEKLQKRYNDLKEDHKKFPRFLQSLPQEKKNILTTLIDYIRRKEETSPEQKDTLEDKINSHFLPDSIFEKESEEKCEAFAKKWVEKVAKYYQQHSNYVCDLDTAYCSYFFRYNTRFVPLPTREWYSRHNIIMMGGPASGKTALFLIAENMFKENVKTAARLNVDDYKVILTLEENPLSAGYTHVESTLVAKKIETYWIKQLNNPAVLEAPNLIFDVVRPRDERILLAAGEHTHHKNLFGEPARAVLSIYLAYCPIVIAIERAHERATNVESKDRGRFVPIEEIIEGHRKISVGLPDIIDKHRPSIRAYDHSGPHSSPKQPDETFFHTLSGSSEIYITQGTPWFSFLSNSTLDKAMPFKAIKEKVIDIKEYPSYLKPYIEKNITLNFMKGSSSCAVIKASSERGHPQKLHPTIEILDYGAFQSMTEKADDFIKNFLTEPWMGKPSATFNCNVSQHKLTIHYPPNSGVAMHAFVCHDHEPFIIRTTIAIKEATKNLPIIKTLHGLQSPTTNSASETIPNAEVQTEHNVPIPQESGLQQPSETHNEVLSSPDPRPASTVALHVQSNDTSRSAFNEK